MQDIREGLGRVHRLKKSRIDLVRKAINLDEFFRLLLLTILEPEKLARIELDIQPQLRQISADPRQLFRMVNSLLNNALEASFAATPVKLEVRETSGFVRISVYQQGPGFPPEKTDMLFACSHPDKHRGDLRPWRALAFVGKYAEAHGGHVFICSNLGKGVNIAVYLPTEPH